MEERSVIPASDEEIADTFSRANRVTAIGSVRALKLIARIREQAEEIAVFKQSIAGTYPVNTMCCDGHERILFYSDFETCPLCAALSKPEPGR